ncbi:DUF502 domain-containing protein [Halarchaeum nitratireducens]|uniref:DUF502 domain-containing protein n=1 Tax=Halarchaeum nitratireducens TaxID=489913 RepID=A0A830GAB7_9EURY|nr:MULTISPECIES: DUF502 domain-containing protein [Halarchaeum]MBP2250302.1 putative membrane protein [Halarchaeum solikamskense]GGN12614.1 hypothetical protein GCM10009021_10840 [Halarchaeum nitratireducens]
MSSWKRDAASGLIVIIPVLVTLYIIYWVFGSLASVALIATQIRNPYLAVLLTLVVFVLVVFAVGYLMRTALGRFLEDRLDDVINRLPGLRIVYNASKMAVETALNGTEEFQKPVKVEPWDGMRMTAFRTGQRAPDGREILFIPTSPNITSGYVVEVEPEDVIETGETAEDALTRVLSAGFGNSTTGASDVSKYLDETERENDEERDETGRRPNGTADGSDGGAG